MGELLQVKELTRAFQVRGERRLLRRRPGRFVAAAGVNLEIGAGEAVALIGESGSGKTTVGRCICGLDTGYAGRIDFDGTELPRTAVGIRRRQTDIQMVFQDSFQSMNPRLTVQQILDEPLQLLTDCDLATRKRRIEAIAQDVGLPRHLVVRRRHQLSGGQQQRVNLARALIVRPRLIVLDEPLSALDASLSHRMLTLLEDLRAKFAVSYLFISHDLTSVERLCERVYIMYQGNVLEQGPVERVFSAPHHPYTKLLLSAGLRTSGRQLDWQRAHQEWLAIRQSVLTRREDIVAEDWLDLGSGHVALRTEQSAQHQTAS